MICEATYPSADNRPRSHQVATAATPSPRFASPDMTHTLPKQVLVHDHARPPGGIEDLEESSLDTAVPSEDPRATAADTHIRADMKRTHRRHEQQQAVHSYYRDTHTAHRLGTGVRSCGGGAAHLLDGRPDEGVRTRGAECDSQGRGPHPVSRSLTLKALSLSLGGSVACGFYFWSAATEPDDNRETRYVPSKTRLLLYNISCCCTAETASSSFVSAVCASLC